MRAGLRGRLAAALIAVTLSAVVLVDIVVIVDAYQALADAELRSSRTLLNALTSVMEKVPDRLPPQKLFEILSQAASERHSVGFVSKKGEMRLWVGPESMPADMVWPLPEALPAGAAPIKSSERITVMAPIGSGPSARGALLTSITVKSLTERVWSGQRRVLVYAALDLVLVLILGLILLERSVVRPLSRISEVVGQVGSRETALHMLPSKGGDEIAQLGRGVRRMNERIEEDRRQIEEQLHALTQANRELKETRSDLLRAEKLAVVGKLAAGIAHEVGNPLGAVVGYLQLAREESDPQVRDDILRRSEREVERIDRLVRDLLTYSRPERGELRPLPLDEVVEEALGLVRAQPRARGVKLEKRPAPGGEQAIRGDAPRLRQVLVNLLLNAVDAAGEGGTVTVSWSYVDDEEVRLEVRDDGPGIHAELGERIFEPFFTTKPAGHGTGLGLAICQRIVEDELKGRLSFENGPGGGTVFEVCLPRQPGS